MSANVQQHPHLICAMLKSARIEKGAGHMPYKPYVPCRHPGCSALVPPGQKYCEAHKPLHPEEVRAASKRGYNARWEKESKRFLVEHPLCVRCMRKNPPRYVKATVVDHIIPHRGDPTLFWDESNWQPLCKKCHDQKTRNEEGTPTYHY